MAGEPTLYEFMSAQRRRIVELCVKKTLDRSKNRGDPAELAQVFAGLVDEIIRALEADAGLPASSPLPGPSENAARLGAARQRHGESFGGVAVEVGLVSDTVGELATEQQLRFDAREYRVFNKCVDTAICSAIERFATRAIRQTEVRAEERFGVIARDLRNALASARMAFAILRRGDVGVVSRTGDLLARSLEAMQELVDPLVLAARLHAGAPLEPKRVRVARLLRDAQESIAPERGIAVLVDVDDALEIETDERVLEAALASIVQTAVRLAHEETLVVLRARREDDMLEIQVEGDCGELPPERVERLFAAPGLAVTREAVEAHGGAVGVRSKPPLGCIFWMRLRIGASAIEPRAIRSRLA